MSFVAVYLISISFVVLFWYINHAVGFFVLNCFTFFLGAFCGLLCGFDFVERWPIVANIYDIKSVVDSCLTGNHAISDPYMYFYEQLWSHSSQLGRFRKESSGFYRGLPNEMKPALFLSKVYVVSKVTLTFGICLDIKRIIGTCKCNTEKEKK